MIARFKMYAQFLPNEQWIEMRPHAFGDWCRWEDAAPLMQKPAWESAPVWARFLVRDSFGRWVWCEDEPTLSSAGWVYATGSTHFAFIPEWEKSLEQRP
jgi:hypothetical protein